MFLNVFVKDIYFHYVIQRHWMGSETAEHWSFLHIAEGSLLKTHTFDYVRVHGYDEAEYHMP